MQRKACTGDAQSISRIVWAELHTAPWRAEQGRASDIRVEIDGGAADGLREEGFRGGRRVVGEEGGF